jgi:D-alanyl-D-alanine carboxypeptidase (penicillin-binding protein 5/6)
MPQPARRLFLALTFFLSTVLGSVASTPALAAHWISTDGKYAAIVVDAATGEVLYSRNPDAVRYPASITKIMTLYLTFEALQAGRLKLTDRIIVSQHAASMRPTKLGLRPGETISVDDAMRAIAVKSANDMAVALAEHIGGSESRFAAMMTLKAQELGMVNTHYVNACGLPDPRQVSSAHDIEILSRAVMRDYPQYYSYFGLQQFVWRGTVWKNHNGLLGKMPGVDGLKTGFINASGFNLSASAVRNGHRLIAVVLGGNSTAARDQHVEDLLDAGFDVLKKRQLGVTTTIAQNLHEPPPIGDITRPVTEEGSADQAGVQIVLTHPAPAASEPLKIAMQDKAPPAKAAAIVAKKDDDDQASDRHDRKAKSRTEVRKTGGDWLVQVGAYKNRGQAQTQLKTIKARFSDQFDAAKGEVQGGSHGIFRARFRGLTATEAHEACSVLTRKHMNCAAYGPTS